MARVTLGINNKFRILPRSVRQWTIDTMQYSITHEYTSTIFVHLDVALCPILLTASVDRDLQYESNFITRPTLNRGQLESVCAATARSQQNLGRRQRRDPHFRSRVSQKCVIVCSTGEPRMAVANQHSRRPVKSSFSSPFPIKFLFLNHNRRECCILPRRLSHATFFS